jgi:hypothetical protein
LDAAIIIAVLILGGTVAMNDVTLILSRIDSGYLPAAEQLLPLVYDELRKFAAARLANEKHGQTLEQVPIACEAKSRSALQRAANNI